MDTSNTGEQISEVILFRNNNQIVCGLYDCAFEWFGYFQLAATWLSEIEPLCHSDRKRYVCVCAVYDSFFVLHVSNKKEIYLEKC